ncbi:MAG: hypothetical protein NTZ05_04545 [Chloroflexi bacterium]|nr:hypothetical protein [Chloroflexota bacterium]
MFPGLEARQVDGLALAQFIGQELGAVGDDADKPFAGRPLTVAEIAFKFFFRIAALTAQVPLELEHRPAPEGVNTASHFRNRQFKANVLAAGPQSLHQQVINQAADFFVTGPAAEFRYDFGKPFRQKRHRPPHDMYIMTTP